MNDKDYRNKLNQLFADIDKNCQIFQHLKQINDVMKYDYKTWNEWKEQHTMDTTQPNFKTFRLLIKFDEKSGCSELGLEIMKAYQHKINTEFMKYMIKWNFTQKK